jgi:hypothetical protein
MKGKSVLEDKAIKRLVMDTGLSPLKLSHACVELAKAIPPALPAADVMRAGLRLMAADFNAYQSTQEGQ